MDANVEAMRVKIARLGKLLFDRFITDAAGGNLSARVGDVVCITARYCGQKYQWDIRPEQVLVVDMDGKILDGEGDISREGKVHLKLYREFPDGNSVVHCHPRSVLVFCAAGKPIQPVLEGTWKFGEIKVVPFAPAHSARLSENVAEAIRGQEARIRKHAAAVIAKYHGLFVLAKDVDAGFDAAERIENNARIILANAALATGCDLADAQKAALGASLAAFE
jgi:L-fuculose-phosphate aldolase